MSDRGDAERRDPRAPHRLEAWSVGEPDPEVAELVERDDEARRYVDGLGEEREQFLGRDDPDDFVRAIRRRAEAEAPRQGSRWWLWAPAGLAAVAALVIVVWAGPGGAPEPGSVGPGDPPGETIRLKGKVELALVLLRAEEQSRLTGEVSVQAGDRLRFELTVPEEGPLSVAILEDGEVSPLVEAKRFTVGKHFLEQALKVDGAEPLDAKVVAGPPEAVKRAAETGMLEGVSVLHLRLDPSAPR